MVCGKILLTLTTFLAHTEGGYVGTDMFTSPKYISNDIDHGFISGNTTMSTANGSLGLSVIEQKQDEIVDRAAEKISDVLRKEMIEYFEALGAFRKLEVPGTVSEANYIGLQEAIQLLGIPNEVDLVFDTIQYSAEGGFLMPYYNGSTRETTVPGPDPCHGGNLADITTAIDVKSMRDEQSLYTSYVFTVNVAFETVPKYVDITFRMRYTDELKDYIPNITAMYEHLKCGREMRL